MNKTAFASSLILFLIVSIVITGCINQDNDTLTKHMDYDGRERYYLVHLPAGYDQNEPMPMVLVLHGGGGDPESTERMTGMSDKADEAGFIAVYPAGTGILGEKLLTWNGGFCCGYAFENNVDDVGFISSVIDDMKRDYNVDPKRVYVTGISNGGIMSYRLGAELSDRIAAISPIVASIGGIAENGSGVWMPPSPAYPVSIIAFNGMQDGRIPYDGGRPALDNTKGAYSYVSVNDSIMFWIKNNNCSTTPGITLSKNGNIETRIYTGGDNGTEVVLYTIKDGGHAWPGGEKWAPWGDTPTTEISANDIMWKFFSEHPKT